MCVTERSQLNSNKWQRDKVTKCKHVFHKKQQQKINKTCGSALLAWLEEQDSYNRIRLDRSAQPIGVRKDMQRIGWTISAWLQPRTRVFAQEARDFPCNPVTARACLLLSFVLSGVRLSECVGSKECGRHVWIIMGFLCSTWDLTRSTFRFVFVFECVASCGWNSFQF